MRGDIREYAKLGLVHHMLYPKCTSDPEFHASSLVEFVKRNDIEIFDCCLPYGNEKRDRVVEAIRNCGKETTYAMHLYPMSRVPLNSPDQHEQEQARMILADQINMAAAISARYFIFVSGPDYPCGRDEARKRFVDFCLWICDSLGQHGMQALLEPFDRDVDKKYLYGPINECLELMDKVSSKADNIGIELDMAHIPLMGENFTDAIRKAAKYIRSVHLGNCIFKNRDHLLYGDKHPPIGIMDGEIDIPELTEILKALLDIGYIDRENRKPLTLEMIPYPGKSVEYTISDAFSRLAKAWGRV